MDLDTLYQEIILDHYKHPHHEGLREPFEAIHILQRVATNQSQAFECVEIFQRIHIAQLRAIGHVDLLDAESPECGDQRSERAGLRGSARARDAGEARSTAARAG